MTLTRNPWHVREYTSLQLFDLASRNFKKIIIITGYKHDKIKNYVGKCWETSIGASEVKMIIPLKVSANMDGSINSVEIVENSMYLKDTFYRATADSARRAVLDCSPLPLPKNKAELFKSFIFYSIFFY